MSVVEFQQPSLCRKTRPRPMKEQPVRLLGNVVPAVVNHGA